MELVFWTLAGFVSGSIPYSYWVGRLARGEDIRQFGDHNPGAANVLRAAGWRWAMLAMVLDFLKGAVPVGLAWFFAGVSGWGIIPVSLAPVLGHAFSPWLGMRGGKAVATTFGVWSGLTLGAGPTVLGLLLSLMFSVFTVSGWAVFLAFLCFGGFVALAYPGTPELLFVWLGLWLVLSWKYRQDLHQKPDIRPGLLEWLRCLK
jgi:glycerol-3-phosphate acyltransferase PlsY